MRSIENIFPFIQKADFLYNRIEDVSISNIFGYSYDHYEATEIAKVEEPKEVIGTKGTYNAYRVLPCNVIILNEDDKTVNKLLKGIYDNVTLNITTVDYTTVANTIEVNDVDGKLTASYQYGKYFDKVDIDTDVFINACANGVPVSREDVDEFLKTKSYAQVTEGISLRSMLNNDYIKEASKLDALRNKVGNKSFSDVKVTAESENSDHIYTYLDSYFAMSDAEAAQQEVVPLLIGPTAVFKSATVKELCKKYNYRLVDFRVAFTSRLDFSGLYDYATVDNKEYSFSSPMEELITCSDGFRKYCSEAYAKLSEIVDNGFTEEQVVSNGNEEVTSSKIPLSDEQTDKLLAMMEQYKEYMKTPVLFFDEITRSQDKGVQNTLVTLLNSKRFNNMTLNGCRFVAATNLDISNDREHNELRSDLDSIYDVSDDIDAAFANRFISVKVQPTDVMERWFSWAKSTKGNKTNIHKVVLDFLDKNKNAVYNDSPVLDKIRDGAGTSEIKAQSFPNYRTWDMTSQYLYSVDKEFEQEQKETNNASSKPKYRRTIIEGYLSKSFADKFCEFLNKNGYEEFDMTTVTDDVGDFLKSALNAGSPALLIGPSALGKCVTGDTIIRVDGGITEIKNLDYTDGFLEREYVVDGLNDYVTTSHTYKELCDNVVSITDSLGNVIKATKNHPLKVLTKNGVEWKRVEDIEIGDALLSKKFDSSYYEDVNFDFNGYMYGFVLGDGSVANEHNGCHMLTLSLNNSRITDLLNENGYREDITKRTRGDNFRSALKDSGKIYRLYKSFPNEKRTITKELWQLNVYNYTWGDVDKKHFPRTGTYSYILSAIAGYIDTDGYIAYNNDNTGYVEFCCKDESLLRDLQDVLSSIGLVSKVGKSRYNDKYDRYYPRLRLDRYNSITLLTLIKDLLVLKREQAVELINKFSDRCDKAHLITPLDVGSKLREEVNMLIRVAIASKGMRRTEYKKLSSKYLQNDLDRHKTDIKNIIKFIEKHNLEKEFINSSLWEECPTIAYLRNCNVSIVTNKEEIGTHEVYDVTIPETHTFIANGFISHNTSRVRQYIKERKAKTGIEPLLINVDLAAKDPVDLMGMPKKKAVDEYVAGPINDDPTLKSVSKSLSGIMKNIVDGQQYGMAKTMTVRAPEFTMKAQFQKALQEGREVILFFDEVNRVTSPAVVSAVFEAISDHRFGGVDFSEQKDRVKIIAACNMSWEDPDSDEGMDYTSTGDLDPAFAARFSIMWKKKYDEKDLASWIEFMQDKVKTGEIDATVVEFVKSLDPEDAVRMIAKVENRQLENGCPSTRNWYALSNNIKSWRKTMSSMSGKMLFNNDSISNDLITLEVDISNASSGLNQQCEEVCKFIEQLDLSSWVALRAQEDSYTTVIDNDKYSAQDIVDTLNDCYSQLKDLSIKPIANSDEDRAKEIINISLALLDAINSIDMRVSNERTKAFAPFIGEEVLNKFTSFFNETYGTDVDLAIELPMLSDITLLPNYLKAESVRMKKLGTSPDLMIGHCLDKIREFGDTFGNTLPPDHYAKFIDGLFTLLPDKSNVDILIRRLNGTVEDVLLNAEADGDEWVINVLRNVNASFSIDDLNALRDTGSNTSNRKSVIL